MPHRFLMKDIALQAGVGIATVDRVLNRRGGVRAQTRRRVERAIAELEQQETQIGLAGRKFLVDVVVEAPERFCAAAEAAMTAQAPLLHPAVFRARFTLRQEISDADLRRIVERIRSRGSHGAILMARDTAATTAQVERLWNAGIPVVALATDLPLSRRIAYAGMDNRAGGETAAYLIGQWLDAAPAAVLVTTRNNRFRGEEEREIAFRIMVRERFAHLRVTELSEGFAPQPPLPKRIEALLETDPEIRAVYSIGGGNEAILEVFEQAGRTPDVFVAHDLDADNHRLLREGRLSAVLHHDLGQDMKEACLAIMRFHRALPASDPPPPNRIRILTPFNLH